MNRKLLVSALAAAVLAIGNVGAAAPPTATTTFQVTITIQNSCGITATDVGFGTFADASVAHNEGSSGTVSVTCTGKGPIKVTLDAGANNPTFGSSHMNFGANFVGYALYSAANGTGLLGDGVNGGTPVFNGTSTGALQNFTIHGYTDTSGGPVPDGTYSDTVTATVTF
jgi:spore coat protein U-like protein